MSKLLSANLSRMKKNKAFISGILIMVVIGIIIVINQYVEQKKYDIEASLDGSFFGYAILIGIFIAAFCSLFIGTEYNDGIIRNKIITGHTRSSVYLSNLIAVIIGSILMCAAFMATVFITGIPLIGFFKSDVNTIFYLLLGTLLMTIAFSAIFTLISMLIQSKSIAAVISIIGIFAMMIAATYINSRLEAPEYYDYYTLNEEDGSLVNQTELNPDYLKGTKRSIYEFLNDFVPYCQAYKYTNMSTHHFWQMQLYSVIILILSTTAGIFVFRRKDIK